MSEQALVNACLIYLRTQDCMVWRANTGAMRIQAHGRRERFVRFGPVGQPDIVGYGPSNYGGVGIAVECKRGRNQPTDAQLTFLSESKVRGVFAVCVWDLEALMRLWEDFKRQRPLDRPAIVPRSRVVPDRAADVAK